MSDVQGRTEGKQIYIETGLEWTKDGHLVEKQKEVGARKYEGAVAKQYNAKREKSQKWVDEQCIIENMLADLPFGDWVVDVPIGTGRFLKFYNDKGFLVRGVDVSDDMLAEANEAKPEGLHLVLYKGDIRALTEMNDKSNDAAVMCRLSRWLDPEGFVAALKELQRVSRKRIIFTARVRNHAEARTYEMIEQGLDGWLIHRDEGLPSDEDYRCIELRPVE